MSVVALFSVFLSHTPKTRGKVGAGDGVGCGLWWVGLAREKRSSTVRQPAHDTTGHCILLPADVMNQTTRSGTPKRPAQTGFQTGSGSSAASQQEPIWTMARWLGASPQFAGGLWGWESWDPHLPAFASRNRVANGRRPRSHDFGCGQKRRPAGGHCHAPRKTGRGHSAMARAVRFQTGPTRAAGTHHPAGRSSRQCLALAGGTRSR